MYYIEKDAQGFSSLTFCSDREPARNKIENCGVQAKNKTNTVFKKEKKMVFFIFKT